MQIHKAFRLCAWAIAACCVLGCRAETKPMSLEEIEAERMALPALYISQSGKQLRAPGNSGVLIDEATREIVWPAYACNNPDCPGKSPKGEPCLFPWPDPRFYVTPEGTLGTHTFTTAEAWSKAAAEAGTHQQPTCPACLKLRNLASESEAERQKYSQFVARYELPETIARRAELDAMWKERKAYIEQRTQGQ